ncbi:MAG: MFS transporter [Gammaproteobacteria bacterium]|nr:MFS transporter [Gammaproteobacteria bacterium]
MEQNQTKLLKRKEKERNELLRLEKKVPKINSYLKYLWVVVIIITIVYVADEIASNLPNIMKPYMIFDLFNIPNATDYNSAIDSQEYANAISLMSVATIPTYIITALLPLYKMLPDKFGRKPFLIINTVGMGVGMMICMLANHYLIYVIGMVLTGFFTPNDIQVIYIMEISPKKHRAKLCSITKGIALLSVSFIGVLKSAFYDSTILSSWKSVFLIPVILAIVIGLSCLILTRETPVYAENRINYLRKTDEERKADEEKAKAESAKAGGIKGALRYIKHSKQLKWIIIVLIIFQFAVGIKGWETEIMLSAGQSHSANNLFLIVEPIVYAVFAFFSGFLSDWLGRKKSCMIFGAFAMFGELAFLLLAKFAINQTLLLAISNGLMYGGLWSFSDALFFTLPVESTPTRIRSTVAGFITYCGAIGMLVGLIIGILFNKIGSSNMGTFQLITFIPFIAVSLILFSLKVRETKDIDIDNVEAEFAQAEALEEPQEEPQEDIEE